MNIFIFGLGLLLLIVQNVYAKDVFEMGLEELGQVKVFSFDVSSELDIGYSASNSVSGSRFDSPIRDLPFAIQAFTDSFIKDQKPVNIFDVARYSPGVTYRSNDFTEGNANLAIRGFAASSTPGNVQILRDGFHGPSIFDFTNISRVEVVKGPASFLYGQLSPGGVVNIITKTPQPRFATTADITVGSYDQYRLEADVTGPFTTDLFYRFSTSHGQDSHYWDAYDAHHVNFSPSLLWQPREKVAVSLKYEYFKKTEEPLLMQKPGYGPQVGPFATASDPNRSGEDVPGLSDEWNSMSLIDFRHSTTQAVSAWVNFKPVEYWDLRTIYSHQEYVVDALFSGNFGMANNTTFLQGRRLRRQIYDNHDDTFEIQGVGKYQIKDTKLRLLLGAEYNKRSFNNWAGQAPNDPSLGSNPTESPLPLWDLRNPATWNRAVQLLLSSLTANTTSQNTTYSEKSAYAGTTFEFFEDNLLVLAGLRFTSAENQLHDNITSLDDPKQTADALTPQYGILYKIKPEYSVYASYAQSFVPGSQTLRSPNGTTSSADPTKGRGYDVGLKFDLTSIRASGTLTFFEVDNRNIVNDLAATNSAGSVVISNVQSGKQRSRGIEFDTTLTMMDNWQLYFSYSYMDARILEFSGNDAAILAQNPTTLSGPDLANYRNVRLFHNARLQMSAPHMANMWTRFDFNHDGPRGTYIGGGFNFIYEQTILPDGPKNSRQTYTLLNAMGGYRWMWKEHKMSADLMGKNLINEHYRPSQSTRGRPREFLVTLTGRF